MVPVCADSSDRKFSDPRTSAAADSLRVPRVPKEVFQKSVVRCRIEVRLQRAIRPLMMMEKPASYTGPNKLPTSIYQEVCDTIVPVGKGDQHSGS